MRPSRHVPTLGPCYAVGRRPATGEALTPEKQKHCHRHGPRPLWTLRRRQWLVVVAFRIDGGRSRRCRSRGRRRAPTEDLYEDKIGALPAFGAVKERSRLRRHHLGVGRSAVRPVRGAGRDRGANLVIEVPPASQEPPLGTAALDVAFGAEVEIDAALVLVRLDSPHHAPARRLPVLVGRHHIEHSSHALERAEVEKVVWPIVVAAAATLRERGDFDRQAARRSHLDWQGRMHRSATERALCARPGPSDRTEEILLKTARKGIKHACCQQRYTHRDRVGRGFDSRLCTTPNGICDCTVS